MKFIVEIPDDTIQWAHAEGVNRQSIAKFMREELKLASSRHGHSPELNRAKLPGQSHEWRGFIFNEARVRCPRVSFPSAQSAKANSISRRKGG